MSAESRRKIGLSETGDKHHFWKGEKAGYSAKHSWAKRMWGNEKLCEHCGLDKVPEGKKKFFEWANISGKYKRVREDWKRLCKRCHYQFDLSKGRIAKQKKSPKERKEIGERMKAFFSDPAKRKLWGEKFKKVWRERYKKGNTAPWNKGKKGVQVPWNKGIKIKT